MSLYRFLDGMGDVVDEAEFPDHSAAMTWLRDEADIEEPIERVEFLGPDGDWRWAGVVDA